MFQINLSMIIIYSKVNIMTYTTLVYFPSFSFNFSNISTKNKTMCNIIVSAIKFANDLAFFE